MLNLLIIFAESLSMLIWFHTGFGVSLFKSRCKALFIIGYVTFFFVTSKYEATLWADIVPSLLMYMWCMAQTGCRSFSSFIRYVMCLLSVGFVQLISLEIVYIFISPLIEIKLSMIYILANLICILVALIFYNLARMKKHKLAKPDYYTILVILYIVIMMVVIKYLYEKRSGIFSNLYIFLFVLLIMFIVVVTRGLKTGYELKQKQLELDLKERYEEAYSKLVLEMRRKQHDYKNQITALYSIQLAGNDKEKLSAFQQSYAEKLLEESTYDQLLIGCDNPVLSGYVYSCCWEADRLGIKMHPKLLCTKGDYNIGLHQVIEVLGILINNSMEYLAQKGNLAKEIKLDVHEEQDKLHIYVSNVSEYKCYGALEEMFQLGYSDKGSDRGMGLYSLKKIVERNNGELIVENIKEADVNWLSIKVII